MTIGPLSLDFFADMLNQGRISLLDVLADGSEFGLHLFELKLGGAETELIVLVDTGLLSL